MPSRLFIMSEDFIQETPEDTKQRIESLIENHPVLLFMKGSKLFPQCGFSNTATQILNSFNIDYHTVSKTHLPSFLFFFFPMLVIDCFLVLFSVHVCCVLCFVVLVSLIQYLQANIGAQWLGLICFLI
jgi:hypothetical protein